MSVTEELLRPLLADAARPLITHYDDAMGSRIELSRATIANWAAKTANWLTEECDAEPGTTVSVALPAHWQTVGVLLGAWWCGAHVLTSTDADAVVAFVPPGVDAPNARATAIVALDPLGRGLAGDPPGEALDYLNEIRPYGDVFQPWQPVPASTPALDTDTVDSLLARSRSRATELGITPGVRILSTLDWSTPASLLDGLLAPLAAGASVVQCAAVAAVDVLAGRAETERTTLRLG